MNKERAEKIQKALNKVADAFFCILFTGLALLAISCIGVVVHALWVEGLGAVVIAVAVFLALVGVWLFLYRKTVKVLGKDYWDEDV